MSAFNKGRLCSLFGLGTHNCASLRGKKDLLRKPVCDFFESLGNNSMAKIRSNWALESYSVLWEELLF